MDAMMWMGIPVDKLSPEDRRKAAGWCRDRIEAYIVDPATSLVGFRHVGDLIMLRMALTGE